MSAIVDIIAREILDSRGNPTIEAEVILTSATFTGGDGRAFFRWRNLRVGSLSWPYVLPQDVAPGTALGVDAGQGGRAVEHAVLRAGRAVGRGRPRGQAAE